MSSSALSRVPGQRTGKWRAARSAELLPVPYFHDVFTLRHELSAVVLQNKRLPIRSALSPSAATLYEVACDLKHLAADIGVLCFAYLGIEPATPSLPEEYSGTAQLRR
jgi:hypothetical protein